MSKKEVIEATVSDFVENFFYLQGKPFSLDDYPHMRKIYNSGAKDIVMKFSRQCVVDDQVVRLSSGIPKKAVDLQEGDPVIGFNTKTLKNEVTRVKNVWDNGVVPCYEIKTRMGHSCKVTYNHPIWTLRGWKDAEKFEVGDDIAVTWDNKCSVDDKKTVPDWKVIATAHLLAEGCMVGPYGVNYCNYEDSYVEELESALKNLHPEIELVSESTENVERRGVYRINGLKNKQLNPTVRWLRDEGLYGKNSQTKHHPDWVYLLTKDQIINYLRIWWNTDGHVSQRKKSIEIKISLISKELIEGLRVLLLKLGIPSRISREDPPIYEGTDKCFWILDILGRRGKEKFLDTIPTDKNPKNFKFSKNDNGKPFSYEADYIRDEVLPHKKRGEYPGKVGYTRHKNIGYKSLEKIANTFDVERLDDLLNADQYFDEVVEVNYLGELSSTNIEVEKTKNFYIDGIAVSNTAKSTTLANIVLARMAMIPNIKQLYVSPAVAQSQEWSRDKLEPVIMNSPLIRDHYVNPKLVQNVLKKEFSNGSVINVRYALLNADRIRGISADVNIFDEVQDLLKDVISVIQETMSRSMMKKNIYAGTPKRTRGTLADLWYRSTQYEYVIKCDACNHWNILGHDNIGLTGLCCSKCGSHLDLRVAKGQWVSTYQNPDDMPDMEGYRVCLLHFAHSPWVNWDKDVIYKMENTSTALFYNETLGLEYDSGSIPITKAELMAACDSDRQMTPVPHKGHRSRPSIMGIDYGPVNSENSFTVISIVQVISGKLQVVYSKRFTGKESDYSFIHEEVPRLFKEWNCTILAADYGMGEAPNSEFRSRLGPEKVLAFQHLPTQKEPIKYNAKMRAYTMNKNYIMNKFFEMLKKGKLRLPRWEDIHEMAQDIRNVIIEYDEEKNTQKYTNSGPDDFTHSTLFATVAAIMLFDLGEILQ